MWKGKMKPETQRLMTFLHFKDHGSSFHSFILPSPGVFIVPVFWIRTVGGCVHSSRTKQTLALRCMVFAICWGGQMIGKFAFFFSLSQIYIAIECVKGHKGQDQSSAIKTKEYQGFHLDIKFWGHKGRCQDVKEAGGCSEQSLEESFALEFSWWARVIMCRRGILTFRDPSQCQYLWDWVPGAFGGPPRQLGLHEIFIDMTEGSMSCREPLKVSENCFRLSYIWMWFMWAVG